MDCYEDILIKEAENEAKATPDGTESTGLES